MPDLFCRASVRAGPALERHPAPTSHRCRAFATLLPALPVAHVVPRTRSRRAWSRERLPSGSDLPLLPVQHYSCACVRHLVSLCVRSSDRGESRSAERRARMVVVCLGPFPIPRIAVWQLGVSTSVLLYCYIRILLLSLLTFILAAVVGGAPLPKTTRTESRADSDPRHIPVRVRNAQQPTLW